MYANIVSKIEERFNVAIENKSNLTEACITYGGRNDL